MNRAALSPKLCTTCGAAFAADALFCPSDGTPLSNHTAVAAHASGPDSIDPYLGREISGHIEIRQLAGVGAMGKVYRAFQKGIDRDVAVKVLHRELSTNQQLVTRFHREAKVASRLQHPNVVQVHLAGQLPDGAMYIVMEYLDGLSLQSALSAAGGAMPLRRALRIALQLCDAVGEAHTQGVVHRDLKPENVMLVRRGDDPDTVKVLDFGIARLNWGEQSMATAAGLIFGTARYISPEGAQGVQVGPAGDVYGIATLVFQMLAGRTPFEGDQAVALLVQQIHDTPPDLRSMPRSRDVPLPLSRAIMKNLAKEPGARDADARTFGRALLDAAIASGLSAEELVVRSGLLSGQKAAGPRESHVGMAQKPESSTVRMAGAAEPVASMARARAAPETPYFPVTAASPGAATAKWAPAAGSAGSAFAVPKPPPSEPKGPDQTLDDESAPIIPAPPSPPLSSAKNMAAPAPKPSEPRRTLAADPSPIFGGASDDASFGLPGRPHPPTPTAPGATISKPGTADDDADARPRGVPRRGRGVAIVLGCFVIGSMAALGFAYRTGKIGAHVEASSASAVAEHVARAQEALAQKRWDAPPGENVRDLTNDGLSRWPGNTQLLDIRSRATDELVKEALGRKFAGNLAEALRLARLAYELDPSDTTAEHLVKELEASSAPIAVLPPPVPLKPPVAAIPGVPAVSRPAGVPSAAPGTKLSLDVSIAKPRVGQQVELVGKVVVTTKSVVEEPHFTIAGPDGAGTRLAAGPDGAGTFRASFSFLEAGRYTVVFHAKVDGAAVQAAPRAVAVSGVSPAPPSPPQADPPPPPPSATVKWM